MTLTKVTVSVCWELRQGRGPATCHTESGCGRLYNPCMHVEGLCNLCVPRLCNMYVERLATCVQWLWVANTLHGGAQGPCPD